MRLDVCEFITTKNTTDEEGLPVKAETRTELNCEEIGLKTSLKLQGLREKVNLSTIILVDQDDYEETGRPDMVEFKGKTYKVFHIRRVRNDMEITLLEVE